MLNRARTVAGARGQRGYALILAMVALVSLTILGVTAISVAQLDMKITSNLRHHRQVAYGALAGLEQARDAFSDRYVEEFNAFQEAATQPGRCMPSWIGTTPYVGTNQIWSTTAPTISPLVLNANGYGLSTYTVDLCVATCGKPPTGFDVGEQGVNSWKTWIFDVVSTGSSPPRSGFTVAGSSSLQSQGALLYRAFQGPCR